MKRKNNIGKLLQILVTLTLIVLIIIMMYYVNRIQGTARVVNYAGLVRGETQRLVKLEVSGTQSDEEIAILDRYIDGISNGSSSLKLIRIDKADFQDKVDELKAVWDKLKAEIYGGRDGHGSDADIIEISEQHFTLSNEMVFQAETYSQRCATIISRLELCINALIILIIVMLIKQAMDMVRVVKANKLLKTRVYEDERTHLPNRNACEYLLEDGKLITGSVCCMMFDLNSLKFINDNFGHEEGDRTILNFARMIREGIPKIYFVGRYGGDEFIAVIRECDEAAIEQILKNVQSNVDKANEAEPYLKISYAVGYARSEQYENSTLRTLLAQADKNMYINKKLVKQQEADRQA